MIEVVIGHFDAFGLRVAVEGCFDLETGASRRLADQLDDDFTGDEQLAAPVAGDVAEQAMLDLGPLAGAGAGSA